MSRSGYIDDDYDQWAHIKWRGQVASAIRGKRGQAFLRELIVALDAMPVKRLIAHELVTEAKPPAFIPPEVANIPAVCAIGSVGVRRGVDMKSMDTHDYDAIAGTFGIAHQLVQEIEYMNDEMGFNFQQRRNETPGERWQRMRDWAMSHLKDVTP